MAAAPNDAVRTPETTEGPPQMAANQKPGSISEGGRPPSIESTESTDRSSSTDDAITGTAIVKQNKPPSLILGKRGIESDRTNSSDEVSQMRSALSARLAGPLSWRPLASARAWMTPRSSSEPKHTDPKRVCEGLRGLSLRAALNKPAQIVELLKSDPLSGERYDDSKRRERYDANLRDSDGDRFPLHWAAARGHLSCVQELLKAGADVSVLDASGSTPAELALACNQSAVYEYLVYGPSLPDTKPITGKEGPISMHCALGQHKQVAECLKAVAEHDPSFFDPNKRDADGDRYPLHWAAARGSTKCINALLDGGACLGALDAGGYTAAALAVTFNQRAAHALLMQAIGDMPTPGNTPPPTPRAVVSPAPATAGGAAIAAIAPLGAAGMYHAAAGAAGAKAHVSAAATAWREVRAIDKENDVPRTASPKASPKASPQSQRALLLVGSPLLPGIHEPRERDLSLSLDVGPPTPLRQLL